MHLCGSILLESQSAMRSDLEENGTHNLSTCQSCSCDSLTGDAGPYDLIHILYLGLTEHLLSLNFEPVFFDGFLVHSTLCYNNLCMHACMYVE